MILGSMRAAFRGLRDKAGEADASACCATSPSCPSPPIVHLPETYATTSTCFQICPNCSCLSHDCDIRDSPRFAGDGARALWRAPHSWGVTPRRDTPGGVKLVGF